MLGAKEGVQDETQGLWRSSHLQLNAAWELAIHMSTITDIYKLSFLLNPGDERYQHMFVGALVDMYAIHGDLDPED